VWADEYRTEESQLEGGGYGSQEREDWRPLDIHAISISASRKGAGCRVETAAWLDKQQGGKYGI